MQTKPIISVIIPNYNRSAFLKQAIESVLVQTYPVLEILIMDDGSNDDSRTVVQTFADQRIKWTDCGKNGRPAIPRNEGLRRSLGNYVAFLDNDDIWFADKLERQVEVLEKQQVNAVCGNARILSPQKTEDLYNSTTIDQLIDFETLVQSNTVICSSVLIKKELLLKSGGFPEAPSLRGLEDYAAWLQAIHLSRFYFMAAPLLSYRDDSSNSIRNDSLSTQQQLKIIHDHFRPWYKDNKGICSKAKYELLRNTFVSRFLSYRKGRIYDFFHP